jgi:hypothetical protein
MGKVQARWRLYQVVNSSNGSKGPFWQEAQALYSLCLAGVLNSLEADGLRRISKI